MTVMMTVRMLMMKDDDDDNNDASPAPLASPVKQI